VDRHLSMGGPFERKRHAGLLLVKKKDRHHFRGHVCEKTERPSLSHPSATTCNHGQRDSAYQVNATGNQSGCRPPRTSPSCRSATPKRQPHAREQRPSPEPIWCLWWIAVDLTCGTAVERLGEGSGTNVASTIGPGARPFGSQASRHEAPDGVSRLRVAQRDLIQIRFSWRSTTCWIRTTRPGRTPRPGRRTTTSIGRSDPWTASPPTPSRVAMPIPLRLLRNPRSIHLGNLSA
jgi:hypothetical protein